MAVAFGAAFGNGSAFWIELETEHQLSLVDVDTNAIERRRAVFDAAPLKEMQRRGWIESTSSPEEARDALCSFFGVNELEEAASAAVATRRPNAPEAKLTPEQAAWCRRVRQLARPLHVEAFRPPQLPSVRAKLRELAAHPDQARHVPKVLADGGIRFVVVEPLTGGKIDGATMWLSDKEPVIGMSVRYDRIDWFWFTLMHEFAHVENGDALSVDANLVGDKDVTPTLMKEEAERLADERAAVALVPPDKLESFIVRVGPLYSKARINQFAHRVGVHPGIITGQLQHRGELGFKANRQALVKLRSYLLETTLTDGWGQIAPPNTD